MNCHTVMVFVIAVLSWASCELALGQESLQTESRLKKIANEQSADASDLNAIRNGSQVFVNAFNQADGKTVAMLWTADGDYIDDAGRKFQGRAAIEKEYADFFKEHRGVKIRIVIDSLRLISSDAAVEDGRAILDPAPAGAPATTKYTAVHVKIDGKWLMSTVRDTLVERPSAYGNIADLEWLIGTWTTRTLEIAGCWSAWPKLLPEEDRKVVVP